MSNETLQAIGRLRRTQGRNPDTMLVCDEHERALKLLKQLANEKMTRVECATCEARKAGQRKRVQSFRRRANEEVT